MCCGVPRGALYADFQAIDAERLSGRPETTGLWRHPIAAGSMGMASRQPGHGFVMSHSLWLAASTGWVARIVLITCCRENPSASFAVRLAQPANQQRCPWDTIRGTAPATAPLSHCAIHCFQQGLIDFSPGEQGEACTGQPAEPAPSTSGEVGREENIAVILAGATLRCAAYVSSSSRPQGSGFVDGKPRQWTARDRPSAAQSDSYHRDEPSKRHTHACRRPRKAQTVSLSDET